MTEFRHDRSMQNFIEMNGSAEAFMNVPLTDRALPPSEERALLVLEATQMGTCDWNMLTGEVVWNDHYLKMLGYVPGTAEYSYADWERRVHPEDLIRVKTALDRAMTDRTNYCVEYRVVWADGTVRWIAGFGRFYDDRDDRAVRMVGAIEDITDRKQAELALQESEERVNLALDAAQIGAFDWDLRTAKIVWNGYYAQLLGYTTGVGDYTYADWARTVHPEDLERVEQAVELARLDRTDYTAEYRIIRPDRSIRWLAGFGRFQYDGDGRAIRMTGTLCDITDRIRSELALQQSEDLFRSTFDQAAVGIAHIALDGQWLLVNQKICEIVGYSEAELRDRTFQAITHPEDLSTDLEYVRQLLAGEIQTYTMEKRYIQKHGATVWVNLTVSLRRDASGAPLHFISAIEDISDRKQNEANLQRSEEFNRRILENNKDCIKVLDLDGRLLYMNDEGKKLLEIEDFGKYDRAIWIEFWGGTNLESANLAWETAKTGKVSKFEGQCPTAMGNLKWWQVTVAPLFDEHGNVEQVLSISHDITERIQAELAIRESEDQFRSTFEQAAVGVAHVALDGRWILVNQKICDIVGYNRAELLQSKFQEITHPDDLAQDAENIRQILAGEIQVVKFEKRYIHKLGHIVWINLTGTLRRNKAGEPLYFIASFEEISDRKQSELALQAQAVKLAKTTALVELRNQELDRFAHIVSHDLKAPLRGIANLAEWIEEDLSEQIDPDTQKNLELMRSRVYRMEGLINGLLEYARVGNTEASLQTFAIEHLLAEIVDSLGMPDRFTIDLPTDLPPITTNRVRLSQVLANLIGNAWKHHDRSAGHIQVTAQPQGELWEFAVTDDGAGIAPENQQRVFEIFQTLTSRGQDSTGIGLSIVKKIVESQGGKISIECPLARGTTFRFTWMVAEGGKTLS